MQNIIIKNGKKFIRPARLPRGARTQKPLEEVLAVYGYDKSKKKDKR